MIHSYPQPQHLYEQLPSIEITEIIMEDDGGGGI